MEIKGSSKVASVQTVGLRVNEGLEDISLTTDMQLTKYSKKYLCCYLDGEHTITLPNAITLDKGWSISFYIKESSVSKANVVKFDGTFVSTLSRGKYITIMLIDNQTTAGEWVVTDKSDTQRPFRNVGILSTGPVITVEDNMAYIGNVLVSVAKGFNAQGNQADVSLELSTPIPVQIVTSSASYFYIHDDMSITVENYRQRGGETLYPASLFENGSIYYSISDGKNYKVVNGEWVEFPAVAIGERTASGQVTVYPFNWWWWLFEDLTAYSQIFYDGLNPITSIQLNAVCLNKDMLTINVGNTILLSNTYTLGADLVTVTFNNPIQAGTYIEARWYVPLTIVGVEGGGSGGSLPPVTRNYTNITGTTIQTDLDLSSLNCLMVFKNGVLLEKNAGSTVNDYSTTTNSVVFTRALVATDKIMLLGIYTAGGGGGGTGTVDFVELGTIDIEMPS